MAEKSTRTPRDLGLRHSSGKVQPISSYCGACGLPGKDCRCMSFKEWGVQSSSGQSKPVPSTGSER